MRCFECNNGKYREHTINETLRNTSVGLRTVYNLPLLICDNCGDTIQSAESVRYFESISHLFDERFVKILSCLAHDKILQVYLIRLVTGCGLADAKKYLRKIFQEKT